MKKITAVLLSLLLAFSALCLVGAAADTQRSKSYPTIMVAGYSSSSLFLNGENGSEKIWGLDFEAMLLDALSNIAKIGLSLGEAAFMHPERLVEYSQEFKENYLKYLPNNPDGSSVYDITSYTRDAAEASFRYIYDRFDGAYNSETEIADRIAAEYGENGLDMIYSFNTDFRRSIVDCAADLDELVESVIAYTGAEKVNIYAVSHGGETTSVYLSEYGWKNRVNNVVLTVPAIGGAALAYDVMSRTVVFDEEELMRFIENGTMLDADIQWLMKAQRLGFLDKMFNALIDGMILDVLRYWGSMWDFIPTEHYEELKAELLDPVESADLIEKSDRFHYEILPNISAKFNECMAGGAKIYIVAGTDNASITGSPVNSDAIIPVASSTGAKCADWGMRFPDGYVCSYTNCSDRSHNHLSPAMNIDASTGYLPEQTWYISGLFHGMTIYDDYSMSLCLKLLFGDELADVRTWSEYPQFHYSTNPCYSVYVEFDASTPGYVSSEDGVLRVTNLSKKYTMRLMDVSVYGADIAFRVPAATYIKPGRTVELRVNGSLPETSLTTCDVVVTYSLPGNVTAYGTRTETFTIMNGSVAESGGEYVPAARQTYFDGFFSDAAKALFGRFGLTDLIKMFFNYYKALMRSLAMFGVC